MTIFLLLASCPAKLPICGFYNGFFTEHRACCDRNVFNRYIACHISSSHIQSPIQRKSYSLCNGAPNYRLPTVKNTFLLL